MKVLYVEDDPNDVDLTRRHLARSAPQMTLDVAGSIREARARLGIGDVFSEPAGPALAGGYDAVLVDLKLPDGSGLDLLAQIRAAALQLAVVVLTGSGDDEAVVTALKSGADDYVAKSADYVQRLPAIVDSAVRRFRESEARRERPLRVLYAEHAAVDVSKVRGHLARHMPNLRLDVVHTARQMLNRLPEAGPRCDYDLLIIDYELPRAGALDVLQEVRQVRGLDVPALVVTRDGDEDAAVQAMTLGAVDYLVKGPDFLVRLPIALENAHLRSQLEKERRALRDSEERFRQLTENIEEVFWLTDADLKEILYVSPSYEAVFERPRQELYRERCAWAERVHPEDRERVVEAAGRLASIGGMDEEYRLVQNDGTVRVVHNRAFPVRDPSGKVYRFAGIAQDITARKEQEARIQYLAYYDGLTGLPNRALFLDRLRQALASADIYEGSLAVVVLDPLSLKTVNETLGHEAGDAVLKQMSGRLHAILHEEDTLARIGGDEFAVVLPRVNSAAHAGQVAEQMLESVSAPVVAGGQELHIAFGAGISLYPRDARDADSLLKFAGTALNQSKALGRNTYCFFSADMNERVRSRLRLETDLRRALDRGELELLYQPQLDVALNRITGLEALLRWNHPTAGLVMPLELIPIAEEAGLIIPIGEWILHTAVEQARAWVAQHGDLRLAVNLSRLQLAHAGLIDTVRHTLQRSGFAAANLELEITESAVMKDPEKAIEALEKLHELGVQLAMDDFGTGYSNLAYLKRFPLDRLKIDASFVQGVPGEQEDVGIVQAIIAMAGRLQLQVIAEGVETEAQRDFLHAQGCSEQQGFLCSVPLSADKVTEVLAARPSAAGPPPASSVRR